MDSRLNELPERFLTTIYMAKDRIIQFGVPGLIDIWVFGSCASATITTKSDVDLCIIVEEQIIDRVLRSKIRECTDHLPVEIDLVFYAKDALNSDDLFTKNLRKNHISLMKGEGNESKIIL